MAVTITGQVQWQSWQDKVLPPVEQLRPWLWSIPVPMPRNALRYMIAYAIGTPDDLVLIDTGWPEQVALDALKSGVEQIGSSFSNISGILITHIHPDHYGLAGEVRDASGAWIAMHEREAAQLVVTNEARSSLTPEKIRDNQLQYLMGMGASEEKANLATGDAKNWARYMNMPQPDRTFTDGELVLPEHGVRAIWTPGHSPGHACYYIEEDELLVAGDHLLPRITPNISVRDLGVGALGQYFESLAKVRELSVGEVLPAHEYRFSDHRARVDDLIHHHDIRLGEILAAVEKYPDADSWTLSTYLSWTRPWAELNPGQWSFAVGETLSHLDYLAERGDIVASDTTPVRWRLAAGRSLEGSRS